MRNYRLPTHVEERLLALLDEGAENFGNLVRDRYAALILRAMQDVANNPLRPGSTSDPAIDPRARFYHLRYSRTKLPARSRIGTPRHILVYEVGEDGVVDILGLIPDMIPPSLALPRFIPERFI